MPTQEAVISEATESDLIQLVDLASQYIKEAERWHDYPFNPTRSIMNALIALEDPNQIIAIAKKGDLIVGFMWSYVASAIWSDALLCQDRFLYVSPDHRDYKTAKRLLTFVEVWAKQQGAIGIHVGANSGVREDRAASLFYKRNKFCEIGTNLYKELL